MIDKGQGGFILHCKLLKCFYFSKAACKNGRVAGWRPFALCVQLYILNLNGRVAGWQTKNYSHTSQWSVVLGHKRAGVDKSSCTDSKLLAAQMFFIF